VTSKAVVVFCVAVTLLNAQRPSGGRQRGTTPPGAPNATEGRIGEIGRVRVHATDEQREQVLTCIDLLELATESVKTGDKLREQIASFNLEHDKLIAGLDKTQREELKTRIRDMGRARDRVNKSLKKPAEMEQALKQLQDQYRELQSDIEP